MFKEYSYYEIIFLCTPSTFSVLLLLCILLSSCREKDVETATEIDIETYFD